MERLMMRTQADKLAVFKLDITPFSPSEDQACPWVWECHARLCPRRGPHSDAYGGSGVSWEQAWARGRTHAEQDHGARF